MASDDVIGTQELVDLLTLGFFMVGILGLAIVIVLVKRVVMHYVDKGRIEAAARQKGWQDVVISWSPFAPGFLFERRERHYRVSYRDEIGMRRSIYCKKSLLTGVYWRE